MKEMLMGLSLDEIIKIREFIKALKEKKEDSK